ncbi:MAG: D-alanyl-D-alanine carboxypeptidase family protein [Ruminococcus sp.]|nr:D-alanyl-D-alanine carboxypeptidase family protein [Ruminococcus sp.]
MKKLKIRPGGLFTFLMACVVLMFTIDFAVRLLHPRVLSDAVVEEGNFLPVGVVKKKPPTLVSDENGELPTSPNGVVDPGYTSKAVAKDDIFKGRLVPYRGNMTVISDLSENRVNLSQYKNDYYSTLGDNLILNKDAADGFNTMMKDYNEATDLVDFAVYGTEATIVGSGSPCPIPFSESKTGNTVDVAIMGCGSILPYDGLDVEKWVVDNCTNYGYIVRYPKDKIELTGESYCPWHLRYVGIPHSLIMGANNWCLEEYINYVHGFTKDDPLECNVGDRNYEIYSVPSMGDVTYISVPLSGNYEISGDGSTGYIITIEK